MLATWTLMSSPTMKVSPILRVRTSTETALLGAVCWSGGSPFYPLERVRCQDVDVLRLVLAHRHRRGPAIGAEQPITRGVALGHVDHLAAEPLGVVDHHGREQVD